MTSKSVGSAVERRKRPGSHDHNDKQTKITYDSDNVFEDLGFEAEEAANLRIRTDLLLDLREHIRERGWSQTEAATFDETQPCISNLLRGKSTVSA